MPCPAPTGLSLRVRSQKRITLEIWQWRFPSGCFYFSWCRLQQAYRASLTGLAYSQTLREHCSTRSLLFSWSCLSWVLLSIDRADPLIPATFVAGCKASVAAKRRLAPLEPHAGAQLSPLIASYRLLSPLIASCRLLARLRLPAADENVRAMGCKTGKF